MEFLKSQDSILGLAVIALIIIGGTGWYVWQRLEKSRYQRQVNKVIGSLGVKYLKDIVIPDGVEGYSYIDYLLLTPNGLVVLDINFSEGHIFGGDSVDQWTQIINSKTYKFNNPLYSNQTRCQAVAWNVENNIADEIKTNNNLDTFGWIAFSSAGDFPKGIPDQVSMIGDLKNDLEKKFSLGTPASESIQALQDKINELSAATRAELGR